MEVRGGHSQHVRSLFRYLGLKIVATFLLASNTKQPSVVPQNVRTCRTCLKTPVCGSGDTPIVNNMVIILEQPYVEYWLNKLKRRNHQLRKKNRLVKGICQPALDVYWERSLSVLVDLSRLSVFRNTSGESAQHPISKCGVPSPQA